MKNLEVYKGLSVPYDFLPNFTPTPNADKSQLLTLDTLKNSKFLGTENLSKEEIPEEFKGMEVDTEALEDITDKKLHYNVPRKVMKKIT